MSDTIPCDCEPASESLTIPPAAMALDYEPPPPAALVSPALRWVRRVLFASGCSFIVAGLLYTSFPNEEEVVGMLSVGLGLIALSVPLPDWFKM